MQRIAEYVSYVLKPCVFDLLHCNALSTMQEMYCMYRHYYLFSTIQKVGAYDGTFPTRY